MRPIGNPRELEWAKKPDALKEGWTARVGTHSTGVSPYSLIQSLCVVRFLNMAQNVARCNRREYHMYYILQSAKE
jgi:hypothetical protein